MQQRHLPMLLLHFDCSPPRLLQLPQQCEPLPLRSVSSSLCAQRLSLRTDRSHALLGSLDLSLGKRCRSLGVRGLLCLLLGDLFRVLRLCLRCLSTGGSFFCVCGLLVDIFLRGLDASLGECSRRSGFGGACRLFVGIFGGLLGRRGICLCGILGCGGKLHRAAGLRVHRRQSIMDGAANLFAVNGAEDFFQKAADISHLNHSFLSPPASSRAAGSPRRSDSRSYLHTWQSSARPHAPSR